MNFMQLLNSLDELLYEVMSWLVFFPLTLWRTLVRPLQTMEYADSELRDREEDQYDDALSPPLFLLIALLLSHGIEMAAGAGPNPAEIDKAGLSAFVRDDSNLLMLRLAVFSLVPMVLAASQVVWGKSSMTRTGLRPPFYAQCYPAGAFALAVGIGGTMLRSGPPDLKPAAQAIIAISCLVYFVVQVAWFRRRLGWGTGRAIAQVGLGFVIGTVLVIGVAFLFV